MLMSKWNNRGDTILEVLIAILIVSSILGAAYASTSRSLQVTRTAQERGEALKIAESQLEQIKTATDRSSPDVIAPDNFCIAGGVVTAACANGLYTTVVNHVAGSHDFVVKVTWEKLGGGPDNELELDYRVL